MIGCAGMIAAVTLVFGFISSLFATEATIDEPVIILILTFGFVFIVAMSLFARDQARHRSIMRTVRKALLARQDVNDHDFCASFPGIDSALIVQTREAISQFFDVPKQKIHPTDNLCSNLQFYALEPGFHSFVVYHVLKARNIALQPFTFQTSDLDDVGHLAEEIQQVINGFKAVRPGDAV